MSVRLLYAPLLGVLIVILIGHYGYALIIAYALGHYLESSSYRIEKSVTATLPDTEPIQETKVPSFEASQYLL